MTVCPKFSHSDRILTKLMKGAAFLSAQSGQTLIWMCVQKYPYLVPLKVDIHFYTGI